jgi:alpha-glucosidase (family GH31 glycosyl hydrolase)
MLNRAIGGAYGFTTDIGGFYDVPYGPTDRELFSRWAEWAALSPFFRIHGSVAAGTHTPWSYDAATLRIYKRLARLHRRAEPLTRRLWSQAQRTGIPVTRPLWLQYPNDPRAARQDQEWLLGPNVLVAPVVEQGARSRTVYFPRGCWRAPGQKRYRGPAPVEVAAPLGKLPWFTRCGSQPLG